MGDVVVPVRLAEVVHRDHVVLVAEVVVEHQAPLAFRPVQVFHLALGERAEEARPPAPAREVRKPARVQNEKGQKALRGSRAKVSKLLTAAPR